MLARMKANMFLLRKNSICDCSRYDQMPLTDQITEIAPYLRMLISELPSNMSTMDFLEGLLVVVISIL